MTTITITDKGLERWLKNYARESGLSLDEVTEALLGFWRGVQEREGTVLAGWDRETLRAEIEKGLASKSRPWDVEEFLEEAHARFKARNNG